MTANGETWAKGMKPVMKKMDAPGLHFDVVGEVVRQRADKLTSRWWIRNTKTRQVLGSVYAQEAAEAIGKAQVKWGIALYQRDGFTAQKGDK